MRTGPMWKGSVSAGAIARSQGSRARGALAIRSAARFAPPLALLALSASRSGARSALAHADSAVGGRGSCVRGVRARRGPRDDARGGRIRPTLDRPCVGPIPDNMRLEFGPHEAIARAPGRWAILP